MGSRYRPVPAGRTSSAATTCTVTSVMHHTVPKLVESASTGLACNDNSSIPGSAGLWRACLLVMQGGQAGRRRLADSERVLLDRLGQRRSSAPPAPWGVAKGCVVRHHCNGRQHLSWSLRLPYSAARPARDERQVITLIDVMTASRPAQCCCRAGSAGRGPGSVEQGLEVWRRPEWSWPAGLLACWSTRVPGGRTGSQNWSARTYIHTTTPHIAAHELPVPAHTSPTLQLGQPSTQYPALDTRNTACTWQLPAVCGGTHRLLRALCQPGLLPAGRRQRST
jgi:hypothetical protein